MVFGVFDGFHPGHEYFLSKATEACEQLIVVVAQDSLVQELKNHSPRYTRAEREARIKEIFPNAEIISGDTTLGSWDVVKKHKPDIVFLGYDQHGIADELKKLKIPFVFLEPYEPHKFKSSLLN